MLRRDPSTHCARAQNTQGLLKWQFAPSFHKIAPPEKMLAYNGKMYYRGYFRAEFVQNSPHSQKSILTPAKIVHIVKKRKHYYILDVYRHQLWKNGSRLNGISCLLARVYRLVVNFM